MMSASFFLYNPTAGVGRWSIGFVCLLVLEEEEDEDGDGCPFQQSDIQRPDAGNDRRLDSS